MKWHLVSNNLCDNTRSLRKPSVFLGAALLLLIYSLSAAERVVALDVDRLWLPKKYLHYYSSLQKAAMAAEKLNRCVEVLDATIDIAQSTKESPIFRILCRQENKRSYVEMVDGLTYNTLTTQEYEPVETLRRQAMDHAIQCKKRLLAESSLMQGFTLLRDGLPDPHTISEEGTIFFFDFDAQNDQGKALHYRAKCVTSLDGTIDLSIRPRRSAS